MGTGFKTLRSVTNRTSIQETSRAQRLGPTPPTAWWPDLGSPSEYQPLAKSVNAALARVGGTSLSVSFCPIGVSPFSFWRNLGGDGKIGESSYCTSAPIGQGKMQWRNAVQFIYSPLLQVDKRFPSRSRLQTKSGRRWVGVYLSRGVWRECDLL